MKSEHYTHRYTTGNVSVEWWGQGDYYPSSFLHRVDGPAAILYGKNGSIIVKSYYLLNKKVTLEDFNTPGFIDSFIMENS